MFKSALPIQSDVSTVRSDAAKAANSLRKSDASHGRSEAKFQRTENDRFYGIYYIEEEIALGKGIEIALRLLMMLQWPRAVSTAEGFPALPTFTTAT